MSEENIENSCDILEDYLNRVNILVSRGNENQEIKSLSEALVNFENALSYISRASEVNLNFPKDDNTDWDKVNLIIQELYLLRAEIEMKIAQILKDQDVTTENEGQELVSQPEWQPGPRAELIFRCDSVKLYFISPKGRAETTDEFQELNIFVIRAEGTVQQRHYLQVGRWVYPLFPSVSPCYLYEAEFKAFIFPDTTATEAGSAIAVVVPSVYYNDLSKLLEEILCLVKTDIAPCALSPRSSRGSYANSISGGLVTGATYISGGLLKGAHLAGNLISQVTPKLIENITPQNQPSPVPETVQKGVHVAKNVSETAASVTGIMARKVGHAIEALGRFLAPHIEKQSTRVLTTAGMDDEEAAEKVSAALSLAGGAVEGFTTIYDGLVQSAAIVASSLAENTVVIVKHKYGDPMGELTGNTLDSVGSILTTSSNIKMLTPRRLIKQSVKETGRAVAFSHLRPEDVQGSSQISRAPALKKD